jgi:HlyD family secretion protein
MKPRLKKWLISVVAVLGVGGIGWFAWSRYAAGNERPTGATHTVARGDLVEIAAASGNIEPHVQVEVKSRASGEVVEVLVKEGQQVKAGELMVKLDPADAERAVREAKVVLRRIEAEIAQSRATVAVAELDVKEAKASEDVASRGAGMGLVAGESERTAKHNAKVADANLRMRRAQVSAGHAQHETAKLAVEDAERRLTETKIFAPFDGTVLSVGVERGTIVSSALTNVSGGSAVATLADLTDLRVIGAIDEAQIGRVKVDQEVVIRVDAYPDRSFAGKVERVAPLGKLETSVVTFDVEIVVTDKDANLLRSGMSADLEIVTTRQEGVLLVPLTAIQSEGAVRNVRLASGERRAVKTGATDGTQIVILEGLEEGDEILLAPAGAGPQGAAPAASSGGASRRGPIPGMGGRGRGMR